MSEQQEIPGTAVSLGEQIQNLVKATRERIVMLELELAKAKQELVDAKRAITGARKTRAAKKVKAKAPKAKRGGRPKGSKNKPKADAAAETPKEE